jgi:hypothetical protein
VAKSIAYGYLPIEKSEPGTKVEITYFDERHRRRSRLSRSSTRRTRA